MQVYLYNGCKLVVVVVAAVVNYLHFVVSFSLKLRPYCAIQICLLLLLLLLLTWVSQLPTGSSASTCSRKKLLELAD